MRATSWLPTRCSYACLLAVVVLVAFPLGSAGAPDEVADRIQRITQVMQGLQVGVPAVTTSGASGQPLTSAKLVAKAPRALAPGVTQRGVLVDIWAHPSVHLTQGVSIARGYFDERAKEVLCQQDRQAGTPCTTDPGAPATDYAEDNTVGYEQTLHLRRGEMKTLRDGSKAVVAVTAESTPWIRLTKGGGNPFPAAIGYAAGTCGEENYVEAFKRKVSEKAINRYASEDEFRAWVRQQNLALKNDVLQLLDTTIERLAAAGLCAAGAEIAFSVNFPTLVIQAVQDIAGQMPLVAGKSGVVVVTPILRGTNVAAMILLVALGGVAGFNLQVVLVAAGVSPRLVLGPSTGASEPPRSARATEAGATPPQDARFCTSCGKPIVAGDAFCTNCGAPLKDDSGSPRCARCGVPFVPGQRFCRGCGAGLG